jgi:hypothetical protein
MNRLVCWALLARYGHVVRYRLVARTSAASRSSENGLSCSSRRASWSSSSPTIDCYR